MLRELTKEKHKECEQTHFATKLAKGMLSDDEYRLYLINQYHIFKTIEDNFELPHKEMYRVKNLTLDLTELGVTDYTEIIPMVKEYIQYLRYSSQEIANVHIYLHYLSLIFGGNIIKKGVPGSGKLYEFNDKDTIINCIRQLQEDAWVDEVNKGYQYMIDIFNQLEEVSSEI